MDVIKWKFNKTSEVFIQAGDAFRACEEQKLGQH
jgi:hypothetical protein